MSYDSSHSHSQPLGFQIKPLSYLPLSINSLHSHSHFSLFPCFLSLETLVSNLYLHLQVSCHSICLILFVPDIRLNTLTFTFLTTSGGTHNLSYGSVLLFQLSMNLFASVL